MSVLAMFNHALNFLAPALWLALLFPLVAQLIYAFCARGICASSYQFCSVPGGVAGRTVVFGT